MTKERKAKIRKIIVIVAIIFGLILVSLFYLGSSSGATSFMGKIRSGWAYLFISSEESSWFSNMDKLECGMNMKWVTRMFGTYSETVKITETLDNFIFTGEEYHVIVSVANQDNPERKYNEGVFYGSIRYANEEKNRQEGIIKDFKDCIY